MKNYEKKKEELLIELAKQDELKNKRLITDMWVLTITTFIFYLALIGISCSLLEEGPILGTIICVSTIVLIIVCFYGFKLEVDAGYYECKHCHHIFEEKNYFKLLIAPHIGTSRYQKCPKCGKKSMAKKVMSKGEYKFNYKIEDNKLYIDFANEKSEDTTYTYSLKKEKLTLKSKNGTFVFKKQK